MPLFRAAVVVALLAVAASASAQGGTWDDRPHVRHRHHGHVHLRIAGDYTLPQDSTTDGPIVMLGGRAHLDGHATDDVVVIGGTTDVGPTAVIDGDLVMIGGTTNVDPAAQIHGDINRSRVDWPDVNFRWPGTGEWWSHTLAFGAMVLRLCAILFGGLLLTLVAPGWMTRVSQRVSDLPGVSVVIGFAAEMLVGPALIVIAIALVISIVGIPLLAGIPVLLASLAIVWVAGFTATAARVGASIRGRHSSWTGPRAGDFVLGFFVLTAITIIGRVLALGPAWMTPVASVVTSLGVFIEYCAWTLGLGAAIGAFFAERRPPPSPPLPPLPTAAS